MSRAWERDVWLCVCVRLCLSTNSWTRRSLAVLRMCPPPAPARPRYKNVGKDQRGIRTCGHMPAPAQGRSVVRALGNVGWPAPRRPFGLILTGYF